jgi:hypothetical protein
MCASSLDELAGLESFLEDARLALVYDKKRPIPARIDSARFDSEQQALVLARILFRFFLPRRQDKAVEIAELRRLLAQLAGLCDRVDELDDSWIREVVRRNVLTNYFMTTALLCDYPGADAFDPSERSVKFADLYLRSKRKKEDELPDTRLVSTVRLFASVAFSSGDERTPGSWRTELDEIERHLRSDKSSFIMPYDRKRYEYLVRQIKRALVHRGSN